MVRGIFFSGRHGEGAHASVNDLSPVSLYPVLMQLTDSLNNQIKLGSRVEVVVKRKGFVGEGGDGVAQGERNQNI